MWNGVLVLIAATGCGRLGFEDVALADAAVDDARVLTPVSIQRGVAQLPIGSTTTTSAISAVQLEHAVLVFSVAAATVSPADGFVIGEIMGTNVRFTRQDGAVASTVSWQVIEAPTLLDVQHGVSLGQGTGITDLSVSITPVDPARSFVIASQRTVGAAYDEDDHVRVTLTGPTLDLHVGRPGTSLPTALAYQVITVRDAAVQHGVVSLAPGELTTASSVAPIDLRNSLARLSYSMTFDNGDVGSLQLRPQLSPAAITIERDRAIVDASVAWSVVSTPSFQVLHGTTEFALGEPLQTLALEPVDLARSFVIVAGSRTPLAGTDPADRVGVAWFRADLASTSLTLTRNDTLEKAEVAWSVVSL